MLDPYFSATKAAWLLTPRRPALEAPAVPNLSFCTVDAWVLWNLTGGDRGGVYATDPSNASRTLLLRHRPARLVPRVLRPLRRPGTHPARGATRRPAASALLTGRPGPRLGDPRRRPRPGVLGDQQAALFGQACFEPGMVKVTYGTGSFALANAGPERPAAPDGLTVSCAWDLGAADELGRVAYALEGSTFVSGAAIQWLRDGLGIIERAADVGPLAALGARQRRGHVRPGAHRPWAARGGIPDARGIVTGLTRGVGRAQLARACVEGMAFQVRDMTDAMAAASSTHWPRCGRTVAPLPWTSSSNCRPSRAACPWHGRARLESTALGAATLAGLAEGVWQSLDELASLWTLDVQYVPTTDAPMADAAYVQWRRAVVPARALSSDPSREFVNDFPGHCRWVRRAGGRDFGFVGAAFIP